MSNYQRLISYIYTYEGGIKGKNIGFAKLETRNVQCKVTVNVKKIFVGGNPMGVYLLSNQGELRIGTLFARNGAGEFRTTVNSANIEDSGRGIDEFFGLSVHDVESAWRAYTTIWEDAVAHAAEVELAEVTSENLLKKQAEEPEAKNGTEKYLPISGEIEAELELEEKSRFYQWESGDVTVEDYDAEMKGSVREGWKREGAGIRERLMNSRPPVTAISESTSEPASKPAMMPVFAAESSFPQGQAGSKAAAEMQPADIGCPQTWQEMPQPVTPQPEMPQQPQTPQPEMPQQPQTPQPEMPQQPQTPQPEMPQPQTPRPEIPQPQTPRPEMPQPGTPRPEMPQPQRPRPEMPQPGTPQPEMPQPQTPQPEPYRVNKGQPFTDERRPMSFVSPAKDEKETKTRQEMWEFLRKKFTKIMAFDYVDGCEILTIKPQDIGLLPRDSWVYGNNSFLLHGYYNYRYLILARLENPEGAPRFLLGIPGNYISNEKYMAAMFGFPDFVLSKNQPSKDSRFGYWYSDVKIGD